MVPKRWSFIFCIVLLLFTVLPAKQTAAFTDSQQIVTAAKIHPLVNGKSTEVTYADTNEKAFLYFNPNGELTQLKNGWVTRGSWEVSPKDRLCYKLAGDKQRCRMLVSDHTGAIEQYIPKQDGNHRLQLKIDSITYGNALSPQLTSSQQTKEILSQEEILSLFSGKTVKSRTVRKKRESLTYYYPDGTLVLTRQNRTYNGAWRVTDNDRVCLRLEDSKEKCRIIVLEGDLYGKYIVKKNGDHQQSIDYLWFKPGKHF